MAEASHLIKAGRIDNILFEYAPAYFVGSLNDRGPENTDALPRMMLNLFDAGYTMAWAAGTSCLRPTTLDDSSGRQVRLGCRPPAAAAGCQEPL